jgi:hypothetical protein
MDAAYTPVKECVTRSRTRAPDCRTAWFGVYSGHRIIHTKSFMSKRLTSKKSPRRPATPSRRSRAETPRANRFHTFLKRLRAGGRSNMYGAIPYLMHAFGLDREAAFRIVCDWVDRQEAQDAEAAQESSSAR